MYYKEAILCLMFAVAEADDKIRDDEMVSIISMKDIFQGYADVDILNLYKEYQERFAQQTFSETAHIMTQQIPEELYMGVLSVLADIIVLDFNVDMKEGSFISIVANCMGLSDVAVKTLLLASLSKKLLLDMNKQ